jgi:hypothetical protein
VPAPENQVPTPEVVETPKPVETKIIQATKVPVTPKPVVVQTQNPAPVVEVVENQPANDLKNANLVSEENIVISAGIETPEETVVDLLEPKEDLVLENVEANNTREEIVTLSETNELVTDVTPPEVDLLKTKIIIDQPDNKAEAIIKIDAYLSLDTQEAFVSWAGEKISLANVGDGHWVAYATLTAEQADKILNPIILPNITAIDAFANKSVVDLGLEQIKPVKTSLLNQYFFLKKINAEGAGTLFNISIIYYKIFALLLSIALALNIFVHIKKQNYRVIGSAAMFLILLALLIIF